MNTSSVHHNNNDNNNNFINSTDSQNNNKNADIQDFASEVSFKLDNSSNYLVWKYQISGSLRSRNLFGFVNGEIPSEPPSILHQYDVDDQPNPDYLEWIYFEHFVCSCIHATVVPSLAVKLLDKRTARKKWLYLAKIFSQQVFARKCKLRAKLHSFRRSSCPSIYDYLHRITFITDYLAGIDDGVPKDSDLVMYTLSGLGKDYEGFVAAVLDRETPITFSELCSRLIHYEQEHVAIQETEVADYTAIICQLCNELGHSAAVCQYRYMLICAPSENNLALLVHDDAV